MSHFLPTRAPFSLWVDQVPVTFGELTSLDAKAFAAINAAAGGTWAPLTPIVFKGLGLRISGPLVVSGPFGVVETRGGARFRLAEGDWPRLGEGHPGRARSVAVDVLRAAAMPSYAVRARTAFPGSVQFAVAQATPFGAASAQEARLRVALRLHDGATLARVRLAFRVPALPEKPPTTPLRARVVRMDANGGRAPLSQGDAEGYVAVSMPASADAWFARGAAQTLLLPCDPAHTIDVARFAYVLEVVEAQGPSMPNLVELEPVVVATNADRLFPFASFADLGGTGFALSDGDRVLVRAQLDPSQNGIWIARSGPWTRAADADTSAAFARHTLVAVAKDGGSALGGTRWRCAKSAITMDVTPILYEPFPDAPAPGGTILHGAALDFEAIATTRFA